MRINKHLFIFSSLLFLLTASYFFVLVKFFPLLVHHTFYYCQEMAKVISLSLPGNWGVVVFGILIISVLYTAFKLFATIVQVYKFRQLLSRSIVKNHELSDIFKSLKLVDKVVVLHETKPFAYCFGVRNPKIFITIGLIAMVNRKELEVILRHEKYHLEHRDNLILLVATFIESLFPFFPILTDLIRIYKTDRELLADQAAIHREADKHSLSSILKKLLQYEPVTLPALAPAIADVDTLETRIKSLLSIKVDYPKLGKRNSLLSIISIAALMALMRTSVHAVELHRDGLDIMIVCNGNVSCESVCKDRNLIKSQSISSSYTSKNFSANN
ncbi:hypothetical protein A3D77_07515 [Candidatus Gottesmanbacteria bacterium RIFCSPHIGHO2_02_FULL_39_11]|uniref:Peptidase M56 domain-containing protein n=1 Tax=Candidatus Gottesmanbacteria bacterium RIFCSPHIGHO2_02_FULL_39_11 TaxID=1798382 RepID=A0A1F5ZSG5_9BACT|nr:MAG: hypothetical protein A3D77_07515 [Candidatus Gottesmanbacteria bacterium RIFCSPHIGHO2_02_FULL_39_11]